MKLLTPAFALHFIIPTSILRVKDLRKPIYTDPRSVLEKPSMRRFFPPLTGSHQEFDEDDRDVAFFRGSRRRTMCDSLFCR